jgi:glycosyltransferase involved in cell wall biosynthesis
MFSSPDRLRACPRAGMLVDVRIAAMSETVPASHYRLFLPLGALQQRGHEIVMPNMDTGFLTRDDALSSDVILVLRCHDLASRKLLREARDRGVGIVWDVDDDIRNGPVGNQIRGDVRVRKQIYHNTLKAARLAHVVMTSTEVLQALYESAGIKDVEVLENYLFRESKRRQPSKHAGIVIGWVAGAEHVTDARALPIANTLERIQHEHPDVYVECIGIDLGLSSRYTHTPFVPFHDLPARMAGWDIGLAPISNTTFNMSRSNIKVKEYAASGIPWLASSRGSYANLGQQHGGRLVDDDGWHEAIAAMVGDPQVRMVLGRAGRSWARGETIDAVIDRYEALFAKAVARSAEAVTTA